MRASVPASRAFFSSLDAPAKSHFRRVGDPAYNKITPSFLKIIVGRVTSRGVCETVVVAIKDWKMEALFSQALEDFTRKFPRLGKTRRIFSKPWNPQSTILPALTPDRA